MNIRKIICSMRNMGLLTLAPLSFLHAIGSPTISIVAQSPTTFLLPANSSEMVQYQVTNQTGRTRSLTMKTIPGVSVIAEGCGTTPFVLASKQSCLLTLQVTGSQITTPISGGPVICQTVSGTNTPDPAFCSRPAIQDVLGVSVIAAIPQQQAYVTNWTGNSISLCDVSTLDGSFSNCTVTANSSFNNPEAIALNPDNSLLYVANISTANMSASTVSVCTVSDTGALSNCASADGGPFDGADGISINSANSLAYVSNAGNDTVSVCQINGSGLLINPCTSSGSNFATPSDMTINTLGTRAYISNLITSSVTSCAIDSTTGLLDCDDITFGFNAPEGITLSPSGQFAYVANNGGNNVSACQIDPLTGHLSSCAVTGGQFNGFGNIAFNASGSRAYVPNILLGKVFVCSVNQNTGALSLCRDTNGSGFSGPSGVLLK